MEDKGGAAREFHPVSGFDAGKVLADTMRPGGLLLTERALVRCGFQAGAKVLDVGCGSGATVEFMIERHGLNAVGVDPSEEQLERGRVRNPGLPLLKASGENLPFADGEMDGVFAECTLSVMADPKRALGEFGRVLGERGLLVLSDLYQAGGENCCIPKESLQGPVTREELERSLKDSGFAPVFWEDQGELFKQFVFQMIMENGSLEGCWKRTFCGDLSPSTLDRMRRSRLGYFLLIARKSTRMVVNEG